MTKFDTVLVAAAFALAAACTAHAQTAIEVPAQSFDPPQAAAKPVVRWRPNAPTWVRPPSDGRSFDVNVPLGAGARLPLNVHLLSSEAQCHDSDITSAPEDEDVDFIHDARNPGVREDR